MFLLSTAKPGSTADLRCITAAVACLSWTRIARVLGFDEKICCMDGKAAAGTALDVASATPVNSSSRHRRSFSRSVCLNASRLPCFVFPFVIAGFHHSVLAVPTFPQAGRTVLSRHQLVKYDLWPPGPASNPQLRPHLVQRFEAYLNSSSFH